MSSSHMVQPQLRNTELVGILRTDFQHLNDPPRAFYISFNVGNPPTNAELDSGFGVTTASDLPNGATFLVDDNDSALMWLVVVDATNDQYVYTQLTVAT